VHAAGRKAANRAVTALVRRAAHLSLKSSRCRMATMSSLLSAANGSSARCTRLLSPCIMLCTHEGRGAAEFAPRLAMLLRRCSPRGAWWRGAERRDSLAPYNQR